MKKRYVVRLSAEERDQMEGLVNRGRAVRQVLKKHLLLFYAPFENWRRVDVADNHAATQWAEGIRRLVQEERVESPMSGPTASGYRDGYRRNRRMDDGTQPIRHTDRLAFHHRRCADQVEAALSEIMR